MDFAKDKFERVQVENVIKSDFYYMFSKNNATKEEAKKVIQDQIIPAYKDLSNYIFKEYSKHLRPGPGLVSLFNLKGDQFYEACLEYYSGSKIDPEELHKFGYDSLNKVWYKKKGKISFNQNCVKTFV